MDSVLYRYKRELKFFSEPGLPPGTKVLQYEQVDDNGLAQKVIVEQVRENGDILDADSNEYYMDADSASRMNERAIARARNPDALQRMYTNGGITTPCKSSECYGLCGRRACLDASNWKDI
jgi:hypothetical protein